MLHTQELGIEDFITPQDMVVILSHGGYIEAHRSPTTVPSAVAAAASRRRRSRTRIWSTICSSPTLHDYVLLLLQPRPLLLAEGYEAPQGSRNSRGKPIVDLFPLEEGERINAVLPVKEFSDDQYVFMATVMGTVKKTPLSDYSNPRKAGIIAVALDEDDYLIGVELTNGQSDIVLVSNAGKAVWFDEEDVRPMGRGARGVRGMRLQPGQSVISLLVAESDQQTVLVATENGFGKRTVLADFRHSGRGTQGVHAIADSERNGIVVGAKLVNDEDEIMLITTGGVLIRTRVAEIRGMGRATQGVTLISLDDGEKLAGLEKIVETVGEIEAEAEGAGEVAGDATGEPAGEE